MKLAQVLQKICRERELTLTRLSRETGVPLQTLHGWTSGRKAVQLDQLQKVARYLKISIHELTYGELDPHAGLSPESLQEIFSGDVRMSIHRIERLKPGLSSEK